jgi:uncharacterized protein (TIGR02145 family)
MKMKTIVQGTVTITIILVILILYSCKKDIVKINKSKLTGFVQKGPYIIGTNVFMYELTSSMLQTGKAFNTQISSNNGYFEFGNIQLISPYVEFAANGFYYNEVSGDISIAPLNLFALSNIDDHSTVNINLLTHLEKRRVENLVKQGETFSDAKKVAQSEILGLFGFNLEMPVSEMLDMYVKNESNAVLLAISVILQGNRSVGELTEFLTRMSVMLEDGISGNEGFAAGLRQSVFKLNLPTIRTNLENRYKQLGVNSQIPDFEKYINDFISYSALEPTVQNLSYDIKGTSIKLHAMVNPNSANTALSIEYGATINYGNVTEASAGNITGFKDVLINTVLKGLKTNTAYHCRLMAVNVKGTTFGSDISFTTLDTINEIDGNIYTIVPIGTQTWMADNLKTTRYNNGENIPLITDTLGRGYYYNIQGYKWYKDDLANKEDYGAIYFYQTVNSGKLCPSGWHVPSKDEWQVLIDYLGGKDVAGGKMKETGTEHWNTPNYGATNESCFSALPNTFEIYVNLQRCLLWSTGSHIWYDSPTYYYTASWFLTLDHNAKYVDIYDWPSYGAYAIKSVRCVKN